MAAVSQRFSHEDAHERQINLPQGSRGTQDGEEVCRRILYSGSFTTRLILFNDTQDHSLHDVGLIYYFPLPPIQTLWVSQFDDDEWITLRKIGSGIDDSSVRPLVIHHSPSY